MQRLTAGTIVRLPDGELAEVIRDRAVDGGEVHVIQPEKFLGRGPWIFRRETLVIIETGTVARARARKEYRRYVG